MARTPEELQAAEKELLPKGFRVEVTQDKAAMLVNKNNDIVATAVSVDLFYDFLEIIQGKKK